MKRNYTREAYSALAAHIREKLPGVALCTDIIVGFCGETDEEVQGTYSLLEEVKYDQAFLFAYSDRGKTYASRHYKDDVPEQVKIDRLQHAVSIFRRGSYQRNQQEVGRVHLVLTEGPAKKPG